MNESGRWGVTLTSSSWLFMLLGLLAYYVYWEIEKAKPDGKLGWFNSPQAMLIAWGTLALVAVACGVLFPAVIGRMRPERVTTPQKPSPAIAQPTSTDQKLILAAASGDIRAVKRLISEGADVNVRDEHGWTPLMHAALADQERAVVVLMMGGANERAINRESKTPLMLAVERGAGTAARTLVDLYRIG
jgi:type VI protein secretion system component VasK